MLLEQPPHSPSKTRHSHLSFSLTQIPTPNRYLQNNTTNKNCGFAVEITSQNSQRSFSDLYHQVVWKKILEKLKVSPTFSKNSLQVSSKHIPQNHFFEVMGVGKSNWVCACVCVCVCERERERESFVLVCPGACLCWTSTTYQYTNLSYHSCCWPAFLPSFCCRSWFLACLFAALFVAIVIFSSPSCIFFVVFWLTALLLRPLIRLSFSLAFVSLELFLFSQV
jgi:hypothetical protein